MTAIVVATASQANDLVSLLDSALGYPRDNDSLHATSCFQHPVDQAHADNPPWAVVLDAECEAVVATLTGLPDPVELARDWWPSPPGGG